MLYPHLYIKSLLEEAQKENGQMSNLTVRHQKIYLMNQDPKDEFSLRKQIEEKSLYIEQLHQEVVKTIEQMETK